MNYSLLINNLTNPTLLFFVLGIIATVLKSELWYKRILANGTWTNVSVRYYNRYAALLDVDSTFFKLVLCCLVAA